MTFYKHLLTWQGRTTRIAPALCPGRNLVIIIIFNGWENQSRERREGNIQCHDTLSVLCLQLHRLIPGNSESHGDLETIVAVQRRGLRLGVCTNIGSTLGALHVASHRHSTIQTGFQAVTFQVWEENFTWSYVAHSDRASHK